MSMKLATYKAFKAKWAWLDWMIAIFSLSRYSHTELNIENNKFFSVSMRDNKGGRFKIFKANPKRWDFIDLQVTPDEKKAIEKAAFQQLNKEYDFTGAAFSVIKICGFGRKNKNFCSEIVADILRNHTQAYKELDPGCRYSPDRLHKAILDINIRSQNECDRMNR